MQINESPISNIRENSHGTELTASTVLDIGMFSVVRRIPFKYNVIRIGYLTDIHLFGYVIL